MLYVKKGKPLVFVVEGVDLDVPCRLAITNINDAQQKVYQEKWLDLDVLVHYG